MAGILSFFLPKDKVFYGLFEKASDNLQQIAELLVELVHEPDYNKREALIAKMKEIEHNNDTITHTIFIELGKNFITPFDREDIHSLASALDDVADYIYSSGKKINFYKLEPVMDEGIQKSTKLILEGVIALKQAVMELRNLKNTQKIIDCVIKINNAENEADLVFDNSIEQLFDSNVDAKELIKRRELYMVLEQVTDKCEDAGNVIESIVVKFA
jgi:predicted phosphate transport protein (TIGR00153 family)